MMDINLLYSGLVYDCLAFDIKMERPFLLSRKIKPIWNFTSIVFGPCFTCRGEQVLDQSHINDDIRLKMFDEFCPGCVQVISTNNTEVAVFGDISAKLAAKHGAVGAVCDGYVRDGLRMAKDEFKIFGTGTCPIDAYGKWQITAYNVPIVLNGEQGNVNVNSGDYIFADGDGVLLIPKEIKDEVIEKSFIRLCKENEVREKILHTCNLLELRNSIGRW